MRKITRALAALALCAALASPAAARPHAAAPLPTLIHDHDGNADDLVALALVMRSGRARVAAVTVTPGDAYLEPATRTSQLFLDRLDARGVPVAMGHDEGTNPFPAEWRKAAAAVLDIAALKGARPSGANPVAAEDAPHYLAASVGLTTRSETGPFQHRRGIRNQARSRAISSASGSAAARCGSAQCEWPGYEQVS